MASEGLIYVRSGPTQSVFLRGATLEWGSGHWSVMQADLSVEGDPTTLSVASPLIADR